MFRILPTTITLASLVLVIKVVDLVNGTQTLSDQFLAARLEARQPEGRYSTLQLAALKPAAGEEGDNANPEDSGDGATVSDENSESPDAKDSKEKQDNPKAKAEEEKEPPHEYSKIELDILQSLSIRRQELEEWSAQVAMRESLLDASEIKLEQKIGEMRSLQENIQKLLAEYNTQEDAKIRSLVKIYENMKPKDAARIFEEMDMPILLRVVDEMSERKAAPVLAKMSPTRAKELTIELAEQRKLREQGEMAAK